MNSPTELVPEAHAAARAAVCRSSFVSSIDETAAYVSTATVAAQLSAISADTQPWQSHRQGRLVAACSSVRTAL